MDYMLEYQRWLDGAKDESTVAELKGIAGDVREIEERFYTELAFGTAGLRGILGVGSNRMNVYVVRRATQGLADYLLEIPDGAARGVAVAYDSRHMSREFALETAQGLLARGIKVYLYETLHSVPQLSFAVRHYGCMAGVVITASHNPPEYNGYKVYWEHGGQVGPEQADAILNRIKKQDYFGAPSMKLEEAEQRGLLTMLGEQTDQAYYTETEKLLLHREVLLQRRDTLRIAYTPLHGTGCVPVTTLLGRMGVVVCLVPEQAAPNGAFPTVKAPNPEDPAAFTLAKELAVSTSADVIFATDPDADRLGVALLNLDNELTVLSGNQIACLLLHYILSSRQEQGTLPKNGLVVESFVSTRMARDICAHFGVELQVVPTGFRFISERIAECEKSGDKQYLFGFEESYGFLAGTVSRDKDAICSAMLLAEACEYYDSKLLGLQAVLKDMYNRYGWHVERSKSYSLAGKEGLERIARAMELLRMEAPRQLAGLAVEFAVDMQRGVKKDMRTGQEEPYELNGMNVLQYELENAWVCVRPSGTEPKLKLYMGVKAESEGAAGALLAGIFEQVDMLISGYLGL